LPGRYFRALEPGIWQGTNLLAETCRVSCRPLKSFVQLDRALNFLKSSPRIPAAAKPAAQCCWTLQRCHPLPTIPPWLPWVTRLPLPIPPNDEILAASAQSVTKHGPLQRPAAWCCNYLCGLNQPAHTGTAFNTAFNSRPHIQIFHGIPCAQRGAPGCVTYVLSPPPLLKTLGFWHRVLYVMKILQREVFIPAPDEAGKCGSFHGSDAVMTQDVF